MSIPYLNITLKRKDFPHLRFEFRAAAVGKGPILDFLTMIMSDIHLGDPLSKPKEVAEWLRRATADHIIFDGDIIDGEILQSLKQSKLDSAEHQKALKRLIAKGRETRATFIPGNHDQWLREQLLGQTIEGIRFLETLTENGLHISHGDEVDTELAGGDKQGFWHGFGDKFIRSLQQTDRHLQSLPFPIIPRMAGHLKDYSMAHDLKQLLDSAILKRMKAHHALKEKLDGLDGVERLACGHTHMWGFFKTTAGKIYMNAGSSTDHPQALVQDRNGLWAHLTIRNLGLQILTEFGDKYFMPWKNIGMKNMEEPSKLRLAVDNSFNKAADLLVRHACGAESRKGRAQGFSLASFDHL